MAELLSAAISARLSAISCALASRHDRHWVRVGAEATACYRPWGSMRLDVRLIAQQGRFDSTDSMAQNRIESGIAHPTVPPMVVSWLAAFRPCFTAPVWNHIQVLVAGAVLAPGKRTVTQALRVMGLADQPGFGRYHEVLNRAR